MSKGTHVSLAAICVAILGIAAARAEEKPAATANSVVGIGDLVIFEERQLNNWIPRKGRLLDVKEDGASALTRAIPITPRLIPSAPAA